MHNELASYCFCKNFKIRVIFIDHDTYLTKYKIFIDL